MTTVQKVQHHVPRRIWEYDEHKHKWRLLEKPGNMIVGTVDGTSKGYLVNAIDGPELVFPSLEAAKGRAVDIAIRQTAAVNAAKRRVACRSSCPG